jgi:hypothetical protein
MSTRLESHSQLTTLQSKAFDKKTLSSTNTQKEKGHLRGTGQKCIHLCISSGDFTLTALQKCSVALPSVKIFWKASE